MAARSLPKTEWRAYCDRISRGLLGKQAEIEITGLTCGNRMATKWLPLHGITYDPRADLLEITLDCLDHLIDGPREIAVDDGPEGLTVIQIVDNDKRRQIVKLRQPLMITRR